MDVAQHQPVGVGIIGCGNISPAYLKAAQLFPILSIRGLADANADAAAARAAEFDLPARSVAALLDDPAIELIINLTTPKSHVEVGLTAIAAGKHVYSEKPLGTRLEDGRRLMQAAEQAARRIGCAPDTFLGGGHQTCRALVDAGRIGVPVGGTAYFMCPGHERWHPNPEFYYEVGGGPMLDMGPYYITALVNLLGPIARVAGMVSTPRALREITSEPRRGQMISVAVPTHVAGTLQFASGAIVQLATSFDVAGHRHAPIELYGTEGTLLVPDPNRFGGPIQFLPKGGEWQELPSDAPYGDGNYRSIGAADLAHAIRDGRAHRASGALALHVLEVMEAFGRSSEAGEHVSITTTIERPAPLAESLRDGRLG
jgi:predicted dehydrogenase